MGVFRSGSICAASPTAARAPACPRWPSSAATAGRSHAVVPPLLFFHFADQRSRAPRCRPSSTGSPTATAATGRAAAALLPGARSRGQLPRPVPPVLALPRRRHGHHHHRHPAGLLPLAPRRLVGRRWPRCCSPRRRAAAGTSCCSRSSGTCATRPERPAPPCSRTYLHRRHGDEMTDALFPLLHWRRGASPGRRRDQLHAVPAGALPPRRREHACSLRPLGAWARSPERKGGFLGPYFWYQSRNWLPAACSRFTSTSPACAPASAPA